MRQIWIPKAGPPEVLELRDAPDPQPGPGELRIRVEASGVNFADIMGRLGIYPDLPPMPVVPGYEVAGKVDATGSGVAEGWIGRDVLAMTRFGGYADVVCAREIQVHVRPPGMSAREGAAFPVNYVTAWQLLVVMGRLRKDDTVLIHSAGGGVGIAAIQIARRIGARIIGTASAGKHEALRTMGVETCIDYTAEDFEARIEEITGGRGVDLAIDAVGGRSFGKTYRALARTGRLGMFGLSSAAAGKRRSLRAGLRALATTRWVHTPVTLMNDNKGVFGVNLGHMWDESERVAGWLHELISGYEDGSLRPVIAATFPFERAAEAHHYIHDRENLGKVLLIP